MAIYHHDIDQQSDRWFEIRKGIPTSSEFGKIITPAKQIYSSQAKKYALEKVSEIMTGSSKDKFAPTYYMERGNILENEAIEAYEFAEDVIVKKVGFVTDDKKRFGASPDGLIGDKGCLENKCLDGAQHLEFLLYKEDEIKTLHKPQVQGQMLICERDFCDYNLYSPDLPRRTVRTYRDDKFIKNLEGCLDRFRDEMAEIIYQLQQRDLWLVNGESQ